MTISTLTKQSAPNPVNCQHCDKTIFNGEVIRSRVVNPVTGMAKCTWCKEWTPVPVVYTPTR